MVAGPIVGAAVGSATAGFLVASRQARHRIHHLCFNDLHEFFVFLASPGGDINVFVKALLG